ncbi:hypothetical protein BU15DRAFT_68244 [Melanogaster broomeanus]|nr:hypothetical protein BU15DRAFT_68244 [Melanogaster broomeanus]
MRQRVSAGRNFGTRYRRQQSGMIGGEELREVERRSSSAPPGNPGLAFKQATPIQVALLCCRGCVRASNSLASKNTNLVSVAFQIVMGSAPAWAGWWLSVDVGALEVVEWEWCCGCSERASFIGRHWAQYGNPTTTNSPIRQQEQTYLERSWNRRMQEQQNIDVALSMKGCGASLGLGLGPTNVSSRAMGPRRPYPGLWLGSAYTGPEARPSTSLIVIPTPR